MALWSAQARRSGQGIGFVPTMGALHEGHLDLVRRAKALHAKVVCSIFVNPLQFNDLADLAAYPVRQAEDQALLRGVGCDALFAPKKDELFAGFKPKVFDLRGLDRFWEGPLRPGHFQGVVNVVQRLLEFVRPDAAYFGEKDRQQLRILQAVAEEEHWPERIVACPTVRSPDGLALSSRNLRLSDTERQSALSLHRSLTHLKSLAFREKVGAALQSAMKVLEADQLVIPEYLGVAHPGTLEPLDDWGGLQEAIGLVAARVGPVRLIDNLTLVRP